MARDRTLRRSSRLSSRRSSRLRPLLSPQRDGTRGVAGRRLPLRMQRFEERYERGRLSGAQVFGISGHVAATLDDLSNQLVLCKPEGYGVQGRGALAALIVERVAVMALLQLENQGALPLEGRALLEKLRRNGNPAPRIHDGTPRRISREARKRTHRNRHEQDREHSDGSAAPAFFPFAEKERQEQECENYDHRPNEQSGRFHRRRQEREHRIEPQEEKIRTRRGLNDRGVRRPGRAKRAEPSGADRY